MGAIRICGRHSIEWIQADTTKWRHFGWIQRRRCSRMQWSSGCTKNGHRSITCRRPLITWLLQDSIPLVFSTCYLVTWFFLVDNKCILTSVPCAYGWFTIRVTDWHETFLFWRRVVRLPGNYYSYYFSLFFSFLPLSLSFFYLLLSFHLYI